MKLPKFRKHSSVYEEVRNPGHKRCHLVHFCEADLVLRNFPAWLLSETLLQSMIQSPFVSLHQRSTGRE